MNAYIRKLIVYVVTFILVSISGGSPEAKNYKASFSNRSLRRKFGLSGSGYEWVSKARRRYKRAKERDYRILLRKMNKNN